MVLACSISRGGARARMMRMFAPVAGLTDERCVTGAIGSTVVRLSDDRRRLVDLVTGQTARRLARPAPRPIVGIAASSDGYVVIADAAGEAPHVTVYGPGGDVAIVRRPIGRSGGAISKLLLARHGVAVALGTDDGWVVTSLVSGRTLVSPGGALVTDVAFAPDATAVAETTLDGVVFARLPRLEPEWFVGIPSQAVVWYDVR